jgi:SAM-dependent methyltransferase
MTASRVPVRTSFATIFAAALRGEACTVDGPLVPAYPLPVARWAAEADAADRLLLAHCAGATLDIGCGPGRMCTALARAGLPALGIDLVPEAVATARSRGAHALVRDVFGPLPGEGRWQTALLADGNIGIGGEPVALLRRVRGLLAPGGRVVVDVAPPGTGVQRVWIRLRTSSGSTGHFPWARVGADAIGGLAGSAGLVVSGLHGRDGRWFGVLRRAG